MAANRLYLAAGVADHTGTIAAPGAVLVRVEPVPGCAVRVRATLLASGRPADVMTHPACGAAQVHRLDDALLIPGLVNAHTHLDLTHIGPQPYDPTGGFAGWARLVMTGRRSDEPGITQAVRLGVELNLAAGVVAVGDIAGCVGGRASVLPGRALRGTEINGVSLIECFALGPQTQANIAQALAVLAQLAPGDPAPGSGGVRAGLSPHAPYSVTPWAYRTLVESAPPGTVIQTHLAESAAEHELIAQGTGPLRAMLESMGLYEGELREHAGQGRTPVQHLMHLVPWAVNRRLTGVHLNDLSDQDVAWVVERLGGVVYCPRASAYFGAPVVFGTHRYHELLDRGIAVALGTDSIINLPPGSEDPGRGLFGTLAEMRHLVQADGLAPRTALAMGTVNGARVLGLDESAWSLRLAPGQSRNLAGLVAVGLDKSGSGEALVRAMRGDKLPRLLVLGSL